MTLLRSRLVQSIVAAAALLAAPALAPAATLTPSSFDFGGQSMGTTSPPQAFTYTNNGATAITVASITASAQFAATHNCPSPLAAGASCTINVAFIPAAAAGAVNSTTSVAGTLSVASSAAGSPNTSALAGTGEKSLVTHYYRSILRRAPDAAGKAFWQGEAARVVGLGANVNETWYALASFFFRSAEYVAFNRNNNDFVTDLYATFFNRAPDSGGLAYWNSEIAAGLPREVLLAEFMFSAEFRNFTQAIFGNTAARAEVDVVGDFYRGLLARLPDNGGFDFWVQQFRAAQCSSNPGGNISTQAEAISGQFHASQEYANRNRSTAQFVGDLYNAFLRRGGDRPGVQYWINQIDTGAMSRTQVRQFFVNSPEFQNRVSAIIAQGCFTGPLDCASASVMCVGGPQSEFSTIQAAITAANPAAGKTVLVFDGNHAGFRIPNNRSGTSTAPFTVKANGQNAAIVSTNSDGEGITISNASHVTVEGFRMSNLPDIGIGCHDASPTAPMTGVTIRGNVVTNSRVTNIYCSNATHSLIEGNTASGAKEQHGIYVANGGADNVTIRGNIMSGNTRNGLHTNGDSSIGGDGLQSGLTIEDNVIFGNAANAMDLDGLHDSTIRNNLVYGNGRNGVRVFRIDASAGAGNLRIVNNTIVIPAAAGAAAIKLTDDVGGHTIFNNILINLGTNSGTIVVGNANFKSDYNIVVNGGFSVNEGSTMRTLSSWQSLPGGYDANSIISSSTALFVDAGNNDYRLKVGAPAANAGVSTFNGVPAPAEDIAGVARPQGGAVDRGAYESF